MRDVTPAALARILDETPELARSFLVGGCVRDWLLGQPVEDFDVEVYGLDFDGLVTALGRWGRADLVGHSFGVVKLTLDGGPTFDFTLPRRDSKVAPGHRGFEIEIDPGIDPREAASRRDFTINALMFDWQREGLLDFYGGQEDLRRRTLRHTSRAFGDDPLRVLRGMQFVARFSLTPAEETLEVCRSIRERFNELSVERVREEWSKWAARSSRPSLGLAFLRDAGWLAHFPEIDRLRSTPQDPEWHPEGDVFVHTGHCLDALVGLAAWQDAAPDRRIVLTLAVLAHDFGKPECTATALRDGRERVISPGHEPAGGPITERFLERIGMPQAIRARVVPLVTNHLAHMNEPTPRAVRRLARRLAPSTIADLMTVIRADAYGRPPLAAIDPEGLDTLLAQAAALELEAQAPRPLLLGRHLIEVGLSPGPRFGEILEAAFEAQLDGSFGDMDSAQAWLIAHLNGHAR